MNEEDKRSERKSRIIKFTLFIILVLLLIFLHSCINFEKINDLKPTGNSDTFNIIIGDNEREITPCECEKEDTCPEIVTPEKENTRTKPIGPIDNPIQDTKDVMILDDDGEYNNSTKLNIFTNPYYEFKNIIAPTSSNTYEFVVKNVNNFNIKYKLIMKEINEHNINMKYRLRLDGNYIKGNENTWVTFDELKLSNIKLAANSKHIYQLDWKWYESPNDTEIGMIDADYTLKISFDGEQI